MPLRNLLRAPRRTLMTVLGIGAVITVVVAFLGMIDSFLATVDRTEAETRGDSPSRIVVTLKGFHSADSELVREVRSSSSVAESVPSLVVPGRSPLGPRSSTPRSAWSIPTVPSGLRPRARDWGSRPSPMAS